MTARFPSIAGALALLLGFLTMAPARAEAPAGVAASYDLYVSGLRIASAVAYIQMSDEDYQVTVTAEPRGVLRIFGTWSFTAEAEGTMNTVPAADGEAEITEPAPEVFSVVNTRPGESKTRTVTFNPDGTVSVEMDPFEDGDPVPEELQRGTVDPVTAVVDVLSAVAGGQSCGAELPVFDGRRRFDVRVNSLGGRDLAPSDYSAFSGRAVRCRIRLQPVAGAFQDGDSDAFWRRDITPEEQRRRALDIYLAAPTEGGPVVPVRVEGRSLRGLVFLHLSGITPLNPAADRAEVPGGDR